MTVAVLGAAAEANLELVAAWRADAIDAAIVSPADVDGLSSSDVLIGRVDVRRTLDGIEPGLGSLRSAAGRGIRVLNRPSALLGAHDKLLTARLLERAGIPHPRSVGLRQPTGRPPLPLPVVVKPRFGSWGEDVMVCRTPDEFADALELARTRSWFVRHGALVQELVPPQGHDLRVVVACGRVVGAARRVARPGEWRTNISLGGSLEQALVPASSAELAIAAARVLGADLVGVDLLPGPDAPVVLELNGAIDFDARYALPGRDVYRDLAETLDLPRPALCARA